MDHWRGFMLWQVWRSSPRAGRMMRSHHQGRKSGQGFTIWRGFMLWRGPDGDRTHRQHWNPDQAHRQSQANGLRCTAFGPLARVHALVGLPIFATGAGSCSGRPADLRHWRGFVMVWQGKLVAERPQHSNATAKTNTSLSCRFFVRCKQRNR